MWNLPTNQLERNEHKKQNKYKCIAHSPDAHSLVVHRKKSTLCSDTRSVSWTRATKASILIKANHSAIILMSFSLLIFIFILLNVAS